MTGAKVLETRAVLYELEIPIDRDRDRVWRALTAETDAWWLADFHMAGEGSVIHFDAEAGGRLIERHANGKSLLWYTVLMCDPGVSLDMVGHTSPEWGGPNTSMIRFHLSDREGGTLLRVADAVFGHVTDKTAKSLEDGWRWLLTDGLKSHVEKARDGSAP